MEKVQFAEVIATIAHYGQVDKGGEPYILHPEAVASAVCGDDKIVAWLHDTVEDTTITIKDIRRCFGRKIAKAVDAITQRNGESRGDYIRRAKNNPIARRVKVADLAHNSDLSRIQKSRPLDERDYKRVERYKAEMAYLLR